MTFEYVEMAYKINPSLLDEKSYGITFNKISDYPLSILEKYICLGFHK